MGFGSSKFLSCIYTISADKKEPDTGELNTLRTNKLTN